MTIDLKIDLKTLDDLFTKALMTQLDEVTRDHIISQAISYLMTKQEGKSWNSPKISPLEEAFSQAIRGAATKFATAYIEENADVKKQIEETLKKAMFETLARQDDFRFAVGDAITRVMERRS